MNGVEYIQFIRGIGSFYHDKFYKIHADITRDIMRQLKKAQK